MNRVLALADTSGDGVLYFEEFVKWMLASDNQVMVRLSCKGRFDMVDHGGTMTGSKL